MKVPFERPRESSPKKRMPLGQGLPFLFFPYTYLSFSLACDIKGIRKEGVKKQEQKKEPPAPGASFS